MDKRYTINGGVFEWTRYTNNDWICYPCGDSLTGPTLEITRPRSWRSLEKPWRVTVFGNSFVTRGDTFHDATDAMLAAERIAAEVVKDLGRVFDAAAAKAVIR